MLPALSTLTDILALNTRLFLNCLADVDEDLWTRRPAAGTNHLAYTTCHLIGARFYVMKMFGQPADDPLAAKLEAMGKIDEVRDFPERAEVESAWRRSGERLSAIFAEAKAEQLAEDSGQPFPMRDSSLLSSVTFLVQHESYHIGQLGLLRRLFGLEPMKYS